MSSGVPRTHPTRHQPTLRQPPEGELLRELMFGTPANGNGLQADAGRSGR